MALRPSFNAAFIVEPDPIKKSATTSPGRELVAMMSSIKALDFSQGGLPGYACTGDKFYTSIYGLRIGYADKSKIIIKRTNFIARLYLLKKIISSAKVQSVHSISRIR